MTKLDWRNLKPKEIFLWSVLLLNLLAFFLNVFAENLFFVLFNGAAVVFMGLTISRYYETER